MIATKSVSSMRTTTNCHPVLPAKPWCGQRSRGWSWQGYWNHPEWTVQAWRNLWLHTGDMLMRDDDGNLYFVDRLKDAIRRRGENISSMEVEQEINMHPASLNARSSLSHPRRPSRRSKPSSS